MVVNKTLVYMKTEGSSPWTQKTAIEPYPKSI